MRTHFVSVFAALALFGCSSGDGSYSTSSGGSSTWPPATTDAQAPASGDASGSGHDAGSPSTPPSSSTTDGPLSLVSLSATVSTLTLYPIRPQETVETEIVAIVTHKDGSDHVAGGQLEDDKGHVYGAFGTGANKSTFTLALDWAHIAAVVPLTVSRGEDKVYVAKFFDNDGHRVEKNISITFQCRVLPGALSYNSASLSAAGVLTGAYEGWCFSDTHCGKTGQACARGESCSIRTETCEDVTSCVEASEFPWMPSGQCACGGSRCTPGNCSCPM